MGLLVFFGFLAITAVLVVFGLNQDRNDMAQRMELYLIRRSLQRIEEMFQQVAMGEIKAYELERELNHWGVFEEYQDRFFALVRGKK